MEAFGWSAFVTRKGDRDFSIKCHGCEENQQGYCKLHKKWCNAVRRKCPVKVAGFDD